MRVVADFHIHSKYSRATSRDLNMGTLSAGAKKKGINLLATGDFTHPIWISEISRDLQEDGSGFLIPKSSLDFARDKGVKFILSSEISSIYSKNGKVRKIHNILLAPSIADAKKINEVLSKVGNLHSDGRPILGLDSEKLVEMVWDVSPESLVIPAHIWTPWFSLFGSNSGFDTLEECYGKYSDRIYAYETGLSSDPSMNWRVSQLDNLTLLSNSDAHSVKNLMREANVFEWKPSEYTFGNLAETLKNKNTEKLKYTIEFFPEEGKYHYDGHRNCNIVMNPQESIKNNNICPVCHRPLTLGVDHRVEELSTREIGEKPEKASDVLYAIPLNEIIAHVYGVGPYTKKVIEEADKLVGYFGSEFAVLIDAPIDAILKVASSPLISASIDKMRKGEVTKEPGYDGVFGKIYVPIDSIQAPELEQSGIIKEKQGKLF